jgi:hypothetical protein
MLLTVMEEKTHLDGTEYSIEGSSLASRFGGIAVFGKIPSLYDVVWSRQL